MTAVAGNMDDGKLGKLPREVAGKVGGVRFVVGHKRKRLLKRLRSARSTASASTSRRTSSCAATTTCRPSSGSTARSFLNPGSASAPHYEDDDPTVAIVECGPVGLGVRFVRIPRRADDEG